jgi:hypothetical protein
VFGFLLSVPVPAAALRLSPWANWATLTALAALVYYLALSARLAVGVLIAFAALLAIAQALARLPWPLWALWLLAAAYRRFSVPY